ncbi:hypothetical protein DYB32_000948 [Aphanomyces invadans]|uniref:Peptidase A1 domain-containing protein n=1 Tax=Aphanomyces invadans TaxID=157072 RepID=A0A418B8F2_9STRA|nr:hypothetical protein DYB32_000948 [Aphanomyces invadans]
MIACVLLMGYASVEASARVELPLHHRALLAGVSSVDLVNKKATQYFAPVSMDGKTYNVQVDTGSSDLWFACDAIAPSQCSNSSCPATSRTIQYGSGSVCIDQNNGTFGLGSLIVPNAIYGIGIKSNVLVDGNQGILGLSFPSISVFGNSGVTSNSTKQYPIQFLDRFSMYLTSPEDEAGSKLVLNGEDDDRIARDKLVGYKIPLKETTHWTIQIRSLEVENDIQRNFTQPCSVAGSCLAIVDSGTTFLSMPSFAITYLKPGTPQGCAFDTQSQYYICPKDIALPKLAIGLGETASFVLNSWDYSWVHSETEIIVQIQRNPASGSLADRWILGATFLKVYYTTYHVTDQAITFYCKNGGVCAGGSNLLDFSGKKPIWAMVLMITGGCLFAIGLIGGVVFLVQRRKRGREKGHRPADYLRVDDRRESSPVLLA